MLIPRRTKVERTGIVVSSIALLAVVVGTFAAAPATFKLVPATVPVAFNQNPDARRAKCIKDLTEQKARSPAMTGVARFDGATPSEECSLNDGPAFEAQQRSFVEYAQAYGSNVTAIVTSSSKRSLLEQFLYWGARFLVVGLFLLYLFELTLGRLLRFVWRGSIRA